MASALRSDGPRIAVVGAGAWGINHVRAVLAEPTAQLACVIDHDEAARKRASVIAPHALILGDVDRVLADPTIDALIIATQASNHVTITAEAIRAGKHVLVEKPLALNLDDAKRVAALAKDSKVAVMVGHLMVFHPAVARLRQLVRSNALGRLHYLHSVRASAGRIRDDESALWSFGPHDLSMLDFVLDAQPTRVCAHGHRVLHERLEDVAFVTLEYETGLFAHLHLSRVHPRKQRTLDLVCENAALHFDDVAQEKLRIHHRGSGSSSFTEFAEYLGLHAGEVHIPQLAMDEPLRLQLRHFVSCIADGTAPVTDAASAVRVTEILAGAARSMATGGIPVLLDKPS